MNLCFSELQIFLNIKNRYKFSLQKEDAYEHLVNRKTRLVVQGITGSEGTFYTKQMIEYGTAVVAGVTPGKGGTLYEGNEKDRLPKAVPIFNTVQEAVQKQRANTSIIFLNLERSPRMLSWKRRMPERNS